MSQPPKNAYLWLFWPDGPSKIAENKKILILWYPYFIYLTQSSQFAFIHYCPKIKAEWVTTPFRPPDNAFSKWDHGGAQGCKTSAFRQRRWPKEILMVGEFERKFWTHWVFLKNENSINIYLEKIIPFIALKEINLNPNQTNEM